MNTTKKNIDIAIVEDSLYFNHFISAQIKQYIHVLERENGICINLHSFFGLDDLMKSSLDQIDVAIIDYYLGKGITGEDALKVILEHSIDCDSIIMSQNRNFETAVISKRNGFSEFVHKSDLYAVPRLCFFVENAIEKRLAA